ncbi:MAG: hypothetical protein WC600_06095 [Desulfobaccales bacterium]
MANPVPLKKAPEPSVRLELAAEDLVARTRKILEIKEKVMRENVHYGTIPGCRKPSLWKPGAEILCQGFRLAPEFATTSSQDYNHTIKWEKWDYDKREKVEGLTKGYFEYDTQCTLVHIPTGEVWAKAVSGSCNNFEAKYRSLNPHDVKNTLEKMSEKRALVAAVLIGVGASDIFTQDLEDLPELGSKASPEEPTGQKEPPKTKTKTNAQSSRFATTKQVAFLKDQIKKKGIQEKAFFREWEGEFDSWQDIPFGLVNDILDWIREQKNGK